MVDFSVRLPVEEAAVLIAAITAAKDQFGAPPVKPEPTVDQQPTDPAYSSADALLDVARVFLDTAPQDRSGEDRTLVVVHVSADNLVGKAGEGDVPAGTPKTCEQNPAAEAAISVPAGTFPKPRRVDPTCHIDGVGPIEPRRPAAWPATATCWARS